MRNYIRNAFSSVVGAGRAVGRTLARIIGSWPVSQTPGRLFSIGSESASGVTVDAHSAMSLSGVFAAVNLLSRVISTLPLSVYRAQGRGREIAAKLPAHYLLHTQPNPEMTAATFRRVLKFHQFLGGNAYAEIQWAGNGQPAALWPLEAWRVKPGREDDGTLFYSVDGKRKVAPADMIHVPLVSADGVSGRSFIDYAIESLGLGMATQEFAARYFGNGARPGVILKHPGNPQPQARDEMRRSWNARHEGPRNSGKTAVLWGGWEYGTDSSADAEKSQLLEQRRFAVEEVARWLNIPPHLLRDLSRATFSNIEHQGIDFVVYSVGPMLVEDEQEYDRKLLSPPDVYSKHNVSALLRGDSAARSAYYREQFNIGAMSINEIRELEEMNPVDGGDVHFVPMNMIPLDQAVQEPDPVPDPVPTPEPPPVQQPQPQPEEPPQPQQDSGSGNAANAMRGLLAATLTRMMRVEANAIRRAAEKPGKFLDSVDQFYQKHSGLLMDAINPVALACEAIGIIPARNSFFAAQDWCNASREMLLDLAGRATAADLAPLCEALTGTAWADRPALVAAGLIGGDHVEDAS